jgi:chemotaxis protein MotB
MAETEGSEQTEIFIRRHNRDDHVEHHSGAWKIAFADFMTAMMTLFLVLWLISSTSDKTKRTVAQYFNPLKLVDMATLKKGFRDQKETELGLGSSSEQPEKESDTSKPALPPGLKGKDSRQRDAKQQAAREAALFRDPYAVLADIATRVPAKEAKSGAASQADSEIDSSTQGFADPFTTIPHEAESPPGSPLPLAQGDKAGLQEPEDRREPLKMASRPAASETVAEEGNAQKPMAESQRAGSASKPQPHVQESGPTVQVADPAKSNAGEAAKLKSSIMQALNANDHAQGLPRVEIQATSEGILISLTDDASFSMFAVGSAEPRPETVHIMEKIGEALKAGTDPIIIRGHTDGRPYRSGMYDNWRLSSARAQMALYMLTRAGVNEKRIDKVEGYADHRLKSPNNPNGSENRRIEILLWKDKP